MDATTRRELRLLRLHALITTPVLAMLALSAFTRGGDAGGTQGQKQRFTEIDVERINVVEPDGKLRMVISNRPRSIGPIYKGKPFGYPGGTRPGIIFFNDEGTENGGLTFGGKRNPDGTFSASHHMSFDQFDQDQVVYLQYQDNNGNRHMGLTFADRADINIFDLVTRRDSINRLADGPEKRAALAKLVEPVNGVPQFAPRVYVGRDRAKAAVLNLADRQGKTRLRMVVDSLGVPRIEFLDPAGGVVRTLGAQ